MPKESQSKAWILIPNGEPYIFPDRCVCCLSPVDKRKDLDISTTVRKQTAIGKWIDFHVGMKIRGIPYCIKHAERSNLLLKIIKRIGIIAVIFGLIFSAIATYHFAKAQEDVDFGDMIFSFLILFIIPGGIFYLTVRTLFLIKYPDIWKVSETGTLGFRAIIKAHITNMMVKPKIEGIEFLFDNKEYEKLFLELNKRKI